MLPHNRTARENTDNSAIFRYVVGDAVKNLIAQRTNRYPTHTLPDPFPPHHPDLSN